MDYEEFKLFMLKKINDIEEDELIKLWAIYEEVNNCSNNNSILNIFSFLYEENSCYDSNDLIKIFNALNYINDELQLNDLQKEELHKLKENYLMYNDLNEKMKKLFFKYCNRVLNEKKSKELKKQNLINFYKDNIKRYLSSQNIEDLLNIENILKSLINNECDYEDVRNTIIECYKHNYYNYNQALNWCLGNLLTINIKEFLELAYFLEREINNSKRNKKYLDEYFVLGALKNLNYDFIDNIDNETVIMGQKYLNLDSDEILMAIAKSINDYWYDDIKNIKSGEFIFGIIKEGYNRQRKTFNKTIIN